MAGRRQRPSPSFTDTLELDLSTVMPSLAGPKRPQDRVLLSEAATPSAEHLATDFGKAGHERQRIPVKAERARSLRRRPRRRGDRRHHLLHQHLQPQRADRRRPGRAQGARAGAEGEALGQDLARARLAGGHRLSGQRRPAGRPRRARLQPGGLWLHHLHRQLGPPAAADQRRHQRRRSGRGARPVGQPQLRRPRQPRRSRQLPRLAAAGGGLCAGRLLEDCRHHPRSAQGTGRRRRLPARHLADLEEIADDPAPGGRPTRCSSPATPTCSRATSTGRRSRSPAATPTLGDPTAPTCRTRPTSRA